MQCPIQYRTVVASARNHHPHGELRRSELYIRYSLKIQNGQTRECSEPNFDDGCDCDRLDVTEHGLADEIAAQSCRVGVWGGGSALGSCSGWLQ